MSIPDITDDHSEQAHAERAAFLALILARRAGPDVLGIELVGVAKDLFQDVNVDSSLAPTVVRVMRFLHSASLVGFAAVAAVMPDPTASSAADVTAILESAIDDHFLADEAA